MLLYSFLERLLYFINHCLSLEGKEIYIVTMALANNEYGRI